MYHQNWSEEMDQISCCNGSKTTSNRSSRGKNNSNKVSSSFTGSSEGMRKSKGRGSWGSSTSHYKNSSLLAAFWLILSVGSSMAVMAYQNDLSAISSSSGGSISVSGKSSSASRHGCVWSRTDNSGVSTTATTTTTTTSTNYMSGMYSASGNNPFHHQQSQPSFPALSSSSSSASLSPYYSSSLLASGPSGGSSSTSGGGSGVLTLKCNVRTLNADFQNNTASFSREQVEQARAARVKCSDKLFFESLLSPNQSLFQLRNLREVEIDSCKIRKVPKGAFSSWMQLRWLKIKTDNAQWSPSVGLEIETGAFQGLGQLESLDLSHNNIYLFPDPNVLCTMRNLVKVNVSWNRLTEIDEFGLESGGVDCAFQNLDLSFNSLRRLSGLSRFRRLVELRVSHNNQLEELEDNSFSGLNQLKLLDLSSNPRLVALPPSIFTTSTALRELYLHNNTISGLSPTIFKSLDQLLLLDLSRNSLTSQWIRDSIFSGQIRLIVLKLSFNKLTSLSDPIFSNLISLQALHLDNNEIETISPLAFQSLSNLHILDLSKNRLHFQDGNGRLFSNLFVLRQLYLDHNKISLLDQDFLKNCTSLQDLGLSNNIIGPEVPVALRNAKHLITLDIGENRIETISNASFAGLGQLYGLRMVDNKISEIPKGFCEPMKKLRVLNWSQNRIRKISRSAFSACPELRALRVDGNLLEEIVLDSLPNLLWLNVSENRLHYADYHRLPQNIEWLDLSHNEIENMLSVGGKNTIPSSLRVMDVSYNHLQSIDQSLIPPTLETLRLNYNKKLKTVAPDTFSRATRLRRIEMIGCAIENLPLAAIRFPQIPKGQSLPEMYLGDNPFLCDCSMEWLTRVTQLAVLRQHPRIVDLDAIVCRPTFPRSSSTSMSLSLSSLTSAPSSTGVIPLVEARPKDFLCPYQSHCFALCTCCEFACDCQMTCPDNCSCYHDTAWTSNIVECSNLNSDIPLRIPMDVSDLYLDGNTIPVLKSHTFIGKKNLRVLHLNNSGIEMISNKTFNGLKTLEILHLQRNKLDVLYGYEFADLESVREIYLQENALTFIDRNTFSGLKFLRVLRLDGNKLVDFPVWDLTKNGYLNSIMLSGNPWSCECDFIIPFRRWVAELKNTIVVDFALAKCQPKKQQQDGSGNNSSAIMNSGGSAITTTGSTSSATTTTTTSATSAGVTHPTINSMCAPLTQISFNYNHDNPALLPSAASASSNGGSNHVLGMNNHISSMGGAARNNVGSLQLSGPYHHAHLENQAGNYQGFPLNENIIATTAAAGGGGLRHSKAGHDSLGEDDDASGNSTFYTLLVTFIALILVATIAFLAALAFRKRGRQLSQGSSWRWWCFSKCGINGGSSALPKCLSTPKSSSTNDGSSTARSPGMGGNSADMDYGYYSDQEKLFDAYFIYSQKDEEFVTEKLTCELERCGGAPIIIHPHQQHYYPATTQPGTKKLRLCLHYRDLCLAPDNPWSSEMILSACDASKRIVLVISNNFLNGEWANNHLRTSVHSAIQQHNRKLIVIKLPPVSDQNVSNICSLIATSEQQQRLQPHPVKLEWGDKNFWPKLRLLLPNTQILTTGNNNRNDVTSSDFLTMSSQATANSQLPYTTSINHNGSMLPYQIPMLTTSHHQYYHQPSDPIQSSHPPQLQQQPHFITLMNWSGQHQGIPSQPLGHSLVHPVPSQLTPQHFGYSNIDGFQNNMSSQQQPTPFSTSNNNRQSQRQQQQHQPHHHHQPSRAHPHHNSNHNNSTGHGQHIHSLSQLSNMSSSKSPGEVNYSSSAVSSGNEEFDHLYSTLDSPLESPCSDLGPGHAGNFEGAMISGAQVNRHQIQHSTSSGISSGSDATSGTGGCHPGGAGVIGPPMYFV